MPRSTRSTLAAAAVAFLAVAQARVVPADEPAAPALPYRPVATPDGATLPWKSVDGVKVFHLVAEPVRHEVGPGCVVNAWGYNGRTPGPTIEAVEGDRVRIYVTNRLAEPTSVHWHGIRVPSGMDGVSGLSHPAIPPGETYRYEFTLRDPGTQMYHPHFDEMTQIGMGMMGFFVVHPKQAVDRPVDPRVDRDYCILTHEWALAPGSATPDPTVMADFDVFTFNGRASPGTQPLVARKGERVRIRFGNLSMDSHPIHLHGFRFLVTGTDGGPVPPSARWPETTVDVPVGSTRDIEFVADEPGDWALHCHKTHHTMNQMGHGLPLLLGVSQAGVEDRIRALLPGYMAMGGHGHVSMEGMGRPANTLPMGGPPGPFGPMDMGGMFTVLKVREGPAEPDPASWYANPPGTVASPASADDLRRDLGEGEPTPVPPQSPGHGGHGH